MISSRELLEKKSGQLGGQWGEIASCLSLIFVHSEDQGEP
jgi:hypothetical protein